MICWRKAHRNIEMILRNAENTLDNLRIENEHLQRELRRLENEVAAHKAMIGLQTEVTSQIRQDKDQQIQKLEEMVKDYRREELRTSNDVLISFGVRKPPEAVDPLGRLQSNIAPAKNKADRDDDDINHISPSEWQEMAQAAEDRAFSAEEKLELSTYLAMKRQAKAPAQKEVPLAQAAAPGDAAAG